MPVDMPVCEIGKDLSAHYQWSSVKWLRKKHRENSVLQYMLHTSCSNQLQWTRPDSRAPRGRTTWVSIWLVLATGPGNPPTVRVWTGKTVRFGSRPVQKPDPEFLGGPNLYPYPSTRGLCRVGLDPSVPVSGSPFRVFLFMAAIIYVTVMCKILTLVHHSLYWFHWQPLYSKQEETCSLLHPEVECDQVFIFHHL